MSLSASGLSHNRRRAGRGSWLGPVVDVVSKSSNEMPAIREGTQSEWWLSCFYQLPMGVTLPAQSQVTRDKSG